jgi:dolichyl-phosphate beta-glucosyltransferase
LLTWEIIIINDGSKDKTADVAMQTVNSLGSDSVRLLNLYKNSGKGAAVRKGMMRARGKYLLMADADGATRAADLVRLLDKLQEKEQPGHGGVAIGSRAHMHEASSTDNAAAASGGRKVSRSRLRRITMWGFHTFLSIMVGGAGIKDTQCGFKLFSREAARQLFPVQHIERWAFDVELVYLAARLKVPMVVRAAVDARVHQMCRHV